MAGNGRKFIKGQSGNPKGRPKMDAELRAVSKMSHGYIQQLINKYSAMTRAEVQAKITSQETPLVECAIASIYVKAIQSGDYMRLNALLDRAIGKVTEQLEVKSSHTVYSTTFSPDNNLIQTILDGADLDKKEAGGILKE
jgi:hypothetical protein